MKPIVNRHVFADYGHDNCTIDFGELSRNNRIHGKGIRYFKSNSSIEIGYYNDGMSVSGTDKIHIDERGSFWIVVDSEVF